MTSPAISPVRVRIVVVNFNTCALTLQCLSALEKTDTEGMSLEIVVVDNASNDDSVATIRHQYPTVEVRAAQENTGFAEGCNIGLRDFTGDVVALVNNDTIPPPQWLRPLVDQLMAHQEYGAASPVLIKAAPGHTTTPVIDNAGVLLDDHWRGANFLEGTQLDDADILKHPTFPLPIFSAGVVVLRMAMLNQIGFFDPTWFLYYEDVDLALRAKAAGWQFVGVSRVPVPHIGGATTSHGSPLFWYCYERNVLWTCAANGSGKDFFNVIKKSAYLIRMARYQERTNTHTEFVHSLPSGTTPRLSHIRRRAFLAGVCGGLSVRFRRKIRAPQHIGRKPYKGTPLHAVPKAFR